MSKIIKPNDEIIQGSTPKRFIAINKFGSWVVFYKNGAPKYRVRPTEADTLIYMKHMGYNLRKETRILFKQKYEEDF